MRLGAVVLGSAEPTGALLVAVVPSSAVLEPRGKSAVWVVSATGKAVHRRPVKVLRMDSDTATLAEGVKDGDLVVTAGVDLLAEGQKVSLPVELAQ
jgi:multidrug efflux pump subunit AcrA (membrane-fusion protein)